MPRFNVTRLSGLIVWFRSELSWMLGPCDHHSYTIITVIISNSENSSIIYSYMVTTNLFTEQNCNSFTHNTIVLKSVILFIAHFMATRASCSTSFIKSRLHPCACEINWQLPNASDLKENWYLPWEQVLLSCQMVWFMPQESFWTGLGSYLHQKLTPGSAPAMCSFCT